MVFHVDATNNYSATKCKRGVNVVLTSKHRCRACVCCACQASITVLVPPLFWWQRGEIPTGPAVNTSSFQCGSASGQKADYVAFTIFFLLPTLPPYFSPLPAQRFFMQSNMLAKFRRKRKMALIESSPSCCRSPLRINEILDRIFSFSNDSTLRSICLRVCRQWFQVASRALQRQLHLDHNDYKTWKDLENRLLRTKNLTINKSTVKLAVHCFDPIETACWDTLVARLLLSLMSANREVDDRNTRERARGGRGDFDDGSDDSDISDISGCGGQAGARITS